VDAVSRRLDATAIHFSVDTDQPRNLNLRWPGVSQPITDDPRAAAARWSGLIAAPTPSHIALLGARLNANPPGLSDVFLKALPARQPGGPMLPEALATACHAVDDVLGLSYAVRLLSPALSSRGWQTLCRHLILNADQFAHDYNAALSAYRVEQGITSRSRPMPDLETSGQVVELPLWLDELSAGRRHRSTVRRVSGRFVLDLPGGATLPAGERLNQDLAVRGLRLSPRALTLTIFLRLLVCDLFVHGIGGGRYDQVADRIIANHFNLAPPRFAVATLTLFPPQAIGRTRTCTSCLVQEGHRVRHQAMGSVKQAHLRAIAEAPRQSAERRRLYATMHEALATAAVEPVQAWTRRLEAARSAQREDKMIFDREAFYAFQPADRLAGAINAIRATIG
jgi:hypothetical protein